MGKILDYIETRGNGVYTCYKTNKVSLDNSNAEVLDYDDRPATLNRISAIAETDISRVETILIPKRLIELSTSSPLFRFFLDGSRHVYKVDDIAIGRKIFPVLAGQIVVGCCERIDRDTFKPFAVHRRLVLSLPDDFDYDDEGDNFCRLFSEEINEELSKMSFIKSSGIKVDKMLLYKTDKQDVFKSDKDSYKSRGTAKIQAEMTDEEQNLVSDLCKANKLDSKHFLIKDGSLQYNPNFSNFDREDKTLMKENYRYVVGVSKSFDPELLPDFKGHKLSKTIANLKPFERTKVYRYTSDSNGIQYAVWYLRLRNSTFRETNFSDVIKCEMVLINDEDSIETELINIICANLINEAYPVCYGTDNRWANHLYPVYLTEKFCKSKYFSNDIILNLF